MHQLAPHYERKMRSDHRKKRPRESNASSSSSTTLNHPFSSHLLDDTLDENDDESKITLRVGEEKVVFTSVKPTSSLIKRVYMLSLRERMELDLEARIMEDTLVLNRSLDHFFEDYNDLNDINKPTKLTRNQGDDLMPAIEEGEVIEEFRTRNEDLNDGINYYPNYCDYDKKIQIDYAHDLKFSCMIGFEFTHANLSYYFLENMDAYRDEGIGDIIVRKLFLREVGIKARRFKGTITLYKDDKTVTYQMV
uniref:Uncharacterized protein n=1 Tax=Tanacetum cinerariifolium TaxID=118510 RepID=A0A699J3D3_TANCI|nr:hypothetical protein [Tanacetum cinerariifolium]